MALEDLLHPYKDLYRISPAWFKRTIGQVYALFPMRIRYGRMLAQSRRFLDKSQWWSWEQHREYQWEKMRSLLQHAYENVPYYHAVMNDANLTPADIRSHDDWQKLPYLTKDDIRRHKMELVATNMRHRMLATNTGGSTGQPLEFYWERGRTRALERAFMWRQWSWAGFRYGDRTVVIRGQTVNEGLWHYDPIDRHLFLNAYNLSDGTAEALLEKMRGFRPLSIQAYPSTLALLASWMKRHQTPPIESVKTLLCGSENLYPEQKRLFDEVFKARVYSWYGHGEQCCQAGFCEKEDLYHVYSEYGYMELVAPDGSVLPWTEGQRGEIVGTSLINNTMPFLRYRTGDIGVAGPSKCSCGRNYRLLTRIEGRQQEYIIAADGRAISLTGLVFGQHWHAFAKMRQLQLEQNEPGKVTLRIAREPAFGEEDEREILEKIHGVVGPGLDVTFEYVDYIPPTARGKHVFVRQSLQLPNAWAGCQPTAAPEAH